MATPGRSLILARAISIVAHPFVLLPLTVALPQLSRSPPDALRHAAAVLLLIVVPLAVLIWQAVKHRRWETVDASDRANRPLLYLVCALALLAAMAWFRWMRPEPDISHGLLVAGGMLGVAAALNRWIKASLHVTWATWCGAVLLQVRLAYGIPVLLLVPPLIWSRLQLSRHTSTETLVGCLLGLAGAIAFSWR